MKKKILFTILLVSLLACIFVISASAVTYTYNDENGKFLFSYDYTVTTATRENNSGNGYPSNPNAWAASNKNGDGFAKEDKDGNALTWYIVDTKADDSGNMTFTVKSLKTMGEAGNINGDGAYSFISPVTNKNTVSVNFPDNAGIKTWAFGSFGGYGSYSKNNVLFVYCPNTLTAFSNNPFQETPVMVVELDFETPITEIPQNFAHEARNLQSINIPDSVKLIRGSNANNGTPFYNNNSLVSVNFTENSKLEEMYNNVFLSCDGLTEVHLPNSLKKIGERIFEKCENLEKVYFGANLGNLTQSLVYFCHSLQYIYLPNTISASAGSHALTSSDGGAYAKSVIFFDGTYQEALALKALVIQNGGNNNQKINHENFVEWDSTKSDSYYVELATTENKNYVVYGYNTCRAFYNNEHSFKEPTYGFLGEEYVSSYVKTGVCQNCSNEVVTELVGALFTNKGYSKELDGTYFDYGFSVNREEIAKYEAITGNTVSYGIIAAKKTASESGALIDENGVAIDGAILMSFDTTSYNLYNVKVTGIGSEDAEKELYCSAYVYEAGKTVYIGNTVNEYAVLISLSQIEATMDE